jgi:hypothetical protein
MANPTAKATMNKLKQRCPPLCMTYVMYEL